MKLLIVTQSIDVNNPVLGFFCRWVEEFAKHCEQVTVICLEEGKHNFYSAKNAVPRSENSKEFSGTGVRVFSLGKEEVKCQMHAPLETARARSANPSLMGSNACPVKPSCLTGVRCLKKLKYIFNFFKIIWRERKNYDAVFVHMNQEYVLLGGIFWKVFGKKIFLWRNHAKGGFATRVAVFLSDIVFCTSAQSFTARFKKTKIMPVGIDTDIFKRDESISRIPNSILFLGRISPVKNVDVFIEALSILDGSGVDFIAGVYGDSLEVDDAYYKKIKKTAQKLENSGKIIFHGAVPNYKTPKIYNQNEVFVNLTESGSFDKTILEAAACECLVVVSNQSLKDMLPEQFLFKDKDARELAKKLQAILSLARSDKEEYGKTLRQHAIRHDISTLANSVFSLIKE